MTVTISATLLNDSKNGGLKWTVSGAGALTNTSSSGATYTAPASVASATMATVTATSVTDSTKSATVQITVNPPPAISTSSLPNATAGTAYSQSVAATGGTAPFTWSLSSGTLPTGLSLGSGTSASVTISGTPTGGGSPSNITVKVVDAVGNSTTQSLTLTVNPPPPLSITTTSLPAGVIGTAYNQTLAATGGVPSYSWAVTTGSLPAGLTLNAATGAISGTPSGTFTGTTNFTVTLTDSQTPAHATTTANLSIAVSAPALAVSTTSLPGGTLGTAYSQTLTATGGAGADTWSISSGSLPAGLSLSAAGVISGTPTGTVTGAINFTVKVTDSETPTAQSATKALSITISAAPLSITTSSLPTGVKGSSYSATVAAAGGAGAYSWAVTTGSLPVGISINASTGAISGTPTATGVTSFTVTVTDGETPTPQTANKQLTITVNPQLSVSTTSLSAGVVAAGYNQTLAAAGGIPSYSWAVTTGSLPAGLSLNASTGAITGTPTGPFVGTSNFTVTVTDSESPAKTASQALSITISATTLNITTTSLPAGVINQGYNANLAASGGVSPYTWAISSGTLPTGLTLSSNGAITGTPTVLGTSNFTVQVTDSETPAAQSTTANLSITINNSAPVSVTTTSGQLPTGVVNTTYPGATLQASGGTQPYTWSITSGSLPAGLTLNTSTGAITGAPTTSGTSNFTVKVTDSSSPHGTATANLSITVNAALTITTTSMPNGSVSTAYNVNVNSSGGIGPYTWSITSGSLPAGISLGSSNGSSVTISGTPTTTGTSNFTINVTDSETPAASVSQNLSIDITAMSCPNNASLSGHYALLLQGWTGSGSGEVFFGAAGSFVADGAGNVTSGLIDANDPADGPGQGTFTSGTYCIASNNLGTMTLNGTIYGNPFTTTMAFALQSTGNGNVIFYDTGNIQASGQFFKQDTTAFATSKFSGPYAFGIVGVDPGSGNRLAVAGRFTANGTANLSSGEVDADGPSGPANTTFTSTDFTVAANGRGTVGLVVNGVGTLNFAFYVVNASQLLEVNIDPTATSQGLLAGQVVKQSTSSFTAASLKGVSVIELEDGGPGATLGLVTANGSGTASVNADQNSSGTLGTLNITNFTYTVSSNGRVTVTGAGNHPPVLYLTGSNAAFIVGTDTSVAFGVLEPQSGGPFTNSSLSGNYLGGSMQPTNSNSSEEVDLVQPSAGNVTVTGDHNSTQGNGSGNPTTNTFAGTYAVSSNGRTVVSQSGVQNGVLYIVSPSKFVFIDTTSSNPKLSAYQH